MKKKVLSLLLTMALVATAFTGCGNAETNQTGNNEVIVENDTSILERENVDNTVVYEEISVASKSTSSIDPFDTKQEGKNFIWSVYEMLFEVDGFGGEMFPMLADEDRGEFGGYDHVAGTSDYTVYIHDNIYDSAGNHITASDVAFSYEKTYASGTTSGWDAYAEGCIEVVDDTTLIFHFSKELDKIGELQNIWVRCFIISEKAYNYSTSGLVSDACGTGPYAVTEYTTGSSCTIEARDDYWQTDELKRTQYQQANVKKINYVVIAEKTQYVIGLQTGQVDFVESMSTKDIKYFNEGGEYADKYDVYQYKSNMTYYIEPNCSEENICADVNMRNAIFYAIDTAGLVAALGGEGTTTSTSCLGSDVFSDYNPAWDKLENYQTVCDIEKSKEYQEAAGYKGEAVRFLNVQGYENYAQVIQGMLENAGIKCEIMNYDYATYMTMLADPEAWDLAFGLVGSSDYVVNAWVHAFDVSAAGTGLTLNFVNDKEWQSLLDTCKTLEGHTTENLDAWWQHSVDNAYFMALCVDYNNCVYPEDMNTLLFTDKNYAVINGCTFDDAE